MKKQISTEQTDGNIKEILQLLHDIPGRLENLGKKLSVKKLREPLGKGERSFIQALAHLSNCEVRSSEAIQLALLANEPPFVPIHPERDLGKLLRYDQMSYEELLVNFKFRRKVLLNVLNSLNKKQWARVIREEGKQRRESVYWQARGLALHELEHIQDLENKLKKKS